MRPYQPRPCPFLDPSPGRPHLLPPLNDSVSCPSGVSNKGRKAATETDTTKIRLTRIAYVIHWFFSTLPKPPGAQPSQPIVLCSRRLVCRFWCWLLETSPHKTL